MRPHSDLVKTLVREMFECQFARGRLIVSDDGTVFLKDSPEKGLARYFITNREFKSDMEFVAELDGFFRGLR